MTAPSAEALRLLPTIHSGDRLRFVRKRRSGVAVRTKANQAAPPADAAFPCRHPPTKVGVSELAEALARLNGLHEHLCPRQVLGVRIGLLAARELGFDVPLIDRRIHVVVETDGCFADGVTAATGCAIGHRTLRAIDYGKIAATLVDSGTGRAVRVWPSPDARCLARDYAADAGDRWHAQLTAYQAMPDEALLRWQTGTVAMAPSFSAIHPPPRVACEVCGEEIMGGRELTLDDRVFCRACSDGSYFAAD